MISRHFLAVVCGAVVLMLMAPGDAFAQQGCTLSTSYETIRVGPLAVGGTLPLIAAGACPSSPSTLNTTTTGSWLTAYGSAGPFGASVSFSTEGNFSGAPRTAVIVIEGRALVTVTQGPTSCVSSVTPTTHEFPVDGGTVTFQVQTTTPDCFWTVFGFPPPPFPKPSLPGWAAHSGSNSFGLTGPFVTYDIGTRSFDVTASSNAFPDAPPRSATLSFDSVATTATITQPAPAGPPITLDFGTTPNGISFGAARQPNGTVRVTSAEPIRVTNSVDPNASWNATASEPWIVVTPASGATPATMRVSVDPVVLAAQVPGSLSGFIDLVSSSAPQNPRRLFVSVHYYNGVPGTQDPLVFGAVPFGVMDTPMEGATGLSGAVPVTGWAIDRVGLTRIRIYRSPAAGESAARVYVGDAVRVFGARPDLLTAYGAFSESRLGGWGLMVLSNMLPGGGNGTFTFFADAEDFEGNTTTLGTRTVTFDNRTATKPFGAIDTPTQGGVASGTSFVNFGWALTPRPKTIPRDGSTITVLVDGAPIGTVDYDHPRPDIQNGFPGLNNTNGAIGFKILDTTRLTNGLHTISWTVVDDDGAVEGIGSRFFTVANEAGALTAARDVVASSRATSRAESIAATPRDETPLLARRGWDLTAPWRWLAVGAAGHAVMRAEEVDRLEVWLAPPAGQTYSGYLRVGETLAPLPMGSQLDAATGRFTWAPGVGFVGTYDLVFFRSSGTQALARREVRVILAPKGSGAIGADLEIDTLRRR